MQVKVNHIIQAIEEIAPLGIQEGFDNSGLVVGNPEASIDQVLLCLDITEDVIQEAIDMDIRLIISHHPLIFKGIANLREGNPVNRIIIKAIKHDIVLYSAHTNLDKVVPGVSSSLADAIGLTQQRVLVPDSGSLLKLITFVPREALEKVASALFSEGAGSIGRYDSCSFRTNGEGTFRPGDGAQPFVGDLNEVHTEPEVRLELIVPRYLKSKIIRALLESHPYEEVAFDLISLENQNPYQGLGIVGLMPEPLSEVDFLNHLKKTLSLSSIRHTTPANGKITKVAVCGGSGSEFLMHAKRSGAQAYVSADFKYHQFFDGNGEILIADIGHYESEIFSLEILKQIVTKKLPNFAVHLSKINTNPIKYL